jgi:copper chaperone CopZ
MKTKSLMLIMAIAGLFFSPAFAKGDKQTASFKVWGNCGECKKRIETGARNGGASKASWNEETKMIEVSFDPAKTNVDSIQQSIANTGYDTEKFKANSESYSKLPQCCQYTRKE